MSPASNGAVTDRAITTGRAPAPRGHYSHARIVDGWVFTAGLGPLDPETRTIVGEDVAEQTRQVLRNLSAILEEAGTSLGRVVRATVHLQDVDRDWEAFDEAFAEFFAAPYPVRTTVGSQLGGILVEIDVVASLSG